ncbi:UNVERIFIED_CONTAM: hypothetical protein RF648_19640 [Kocuria sp. CPCC 205274]|uniref:Uncharacterized protein n=1 Tax=Herbiconiux daphne TaxID=2970914 RepID=A0ABT2HAX4_9MICO|nr:hypothetical protein [Herbiconiux daphne]MCS5737057.1 hypothetical protein [Herbiconiux daphne]
MILYEAKDAYDLAKKGWFLTRPGYVYGNGVYLAFGTFPGCLRTGKIDLESFEGHQWKLLTFEELIRLTGYYPNTTNTIYNVLVDTPYTFEVATHHMDMNHYLVDSKYTSADFRNPFKYDEIWGEFFAQEKERIKEKCYPV